MIQSVLMHVTVISHSDIYASMINWIHFEFVLEKIGFK